MKFDLINLSIKDILKQNKIVKNITNSFFLKTELQFINLIKFRKKDC